VQIWEIDFNRNAPTRVSPASAEPRWQNQTLYFPTLTYMNWQSRREDSEYIILINLTSAVQKLCLLEPPGTSVYICNACFHTSIHVLRSMLPYDMKMHRQCFHLRIFEGKVLLLHYATHLLLILITLQVEMHHMVAKLPDNKPVVFVVGAFAHGKIDAPWVSAPL